MEKVHGQLFRCLPLPTSRSRQNSPLLERYITSHNSLCQALPDRERRARIGLWLLLVLFFLVCSWFSRFILQTAWVPVSLRLRAVLVPAAFFHPCWAFFYSTSSVVDLLAWKWMLFYLIFKRGWIHFLSYRGWYTCITYTLIFLLILAWKYSCITLQLLEKRKNHHMLFAVCSLLLCCIL